MPGFIERIIGPIRSSLRNKLIIILISVTIIPVLLSIYISYERFASVQRKTYIDNTTELLIQMNKRLDDYFKQLNDISLALYNEKDLFKLSEETNRDFTLFERKFNAITRIFNQRKEITSILFYYPMSRDLIASKQSSIWDSYFKNASDIEELDWYKQLTKTGNGFIFEPTHLISGYDARYKLNADIPVFSINRRYVLYLNSWAYGVVSINCKLDAIKEICGGPSNDNRQEIVYLNESGAFFYNSNGNSIGSWDYDVVKDINSKSEKSGSFEYSTDSGKYLLVYTKSNYTANILCKLIPLSVLYKQASMTRDINLLICLILVAVLVFTSIFIAYGINKPISRLEKNMEKAGRGDFGSYVKITSNDEIGKISNTFNQMLTQIESLINERYKIRLGYKNAQLKALQAQINPHFLNNTLQAIGSVALDENRLDLYNMAKALSDMLRYSIKSGGNMVTVQEEINNIEDYLAIQKFRYEDKLDYYLDIPESIYPVRVPKLVFQPIVENAVIHGIEPKKSHGSIRICCREVEKFIQITIWDDGIGMSEDEASKLQEMIDNHNEDNVADSEKIGILNVYHRLLLMLGSECRIMVRSQEGEWTEVVIYIPVMEKLN